MAFIRVATTLLLALTLGLAGRVAAQPTSGQELIPLPPCRVADTRDPSYPAGYGPPALNGGFSRNFIIAGQCGVPSTATAVSFNFTVVDATGPGGYLTVHPAGAPLPTAALMQFGPGQSAVVSNPANALLGQGGAISAYASNSGGTVQLIINVYGYYADVEELPGFNTALGFNALLNNTTGGSNTALGYQALLHNTTGTFNTATGVQTLFANTTGSYNTATGRQALVSNTTASDNTATGVYALLENITGADNTATGFQALQNNISGNTNTSIGTAANFSADGGSGNVALGAYAGYWVTTGSNNIHIGNQGAAESATIRLGTPGTHFATYVAGVWNGYLNGGSPVSVSPGDKIGVIGSSARFKEGIEAVGEDSRRLFALRPVRFRYKADPDAPTATRPLQYGLVAEEVAKVFPELVLPDAEGAPVSVHYHLLGVLLVNELQRQERERQDEKAQMDARFAGQQRELDELRAQVRALVGGKAATSP